ncbi:MAG: hypothetical protein IJV62_00570 [Eggerthellaceae bacterium]|nr:hypothetical protein [Eggerthellaceae bacterium]
MMLVDNIAYIYHPELEGIGYDFDGEPAILFYDEEGVQTGFISPLDEEYYYTEENVRYIFNQTFDLVEVTYNHGVEWLEVDLRGLSDDAIRGQLYEKLEVLISEQRDPLINLQFLFDILHHNDFN